MNEAFFRGIVNNITLLLALGFFYSLVARHWGNRGCCGKVCTGVLFGSFAAIGMLFPVYYQPGITFDGRTIILSTIGLFGGPLPTAIAVAMTGSIRIWQGGIGMWAGIATIGSSAIVGLIFHSLRPKFPQLMKIPYLYGFGVLVHIAMLTCMLLLPSAARWKVLSDISEPVLLIYPVATMLYGELILAQEKKVRDHAALIENSTRLRTVIETIPDMIWLKNAEGVYLACNKMFGRFFGAQETEIVGKTDYDFVDKSLGDFFRENDRKAMQAGKPTMNEEEIKFADDGHQAILETIKTPMYAADGSIIGVLGIARDITERKRMEEIERRSVEIQTVLREIADAALRSHTMEELYETVYRQICRVLPVKYFYINLLEETTGEIVVPFQKADISFIPERRKFGKGMTEYIIRLGHAIHVAPGDLDKLIADGEIVQVPNIRRYLGAPLNDSYGKAFGVLTLTTEESQIIREKDVEVLSIIAAQLSMAIERKSAEEELRKFSEMLEQKVQDRTAELVAANKEMEAFSYSVSHDLRAPVRSIDGFCSILLEEYGGVLDDKARDYLNRVKKNAAMMDRLINDLLELARIGRVSTIKQKVDLSTLVREQIDEHRKNEPERKVEVIIQPVIHVMGDLTLLRVVMNNLIDNAWKFTGKTEVAQIEFGVEEKKGQRIFFVRDNGAGFDMAYANKLFSPFQRLHSESEFKGTGIGLAIVSRIIRKHGGSIWAESELNRGASFYFTIKE